MADTPFISGDDAAATTLDLLTPVEAAAFLRLSSSTLANWRCKGVGPRFFRLGGMGTGKGGYVRYDRDDLIAWARSEPCNSTSEYRK